jgi:hypothetical protein
MITNKILLRHIPNYIAAGYNETSLLDKILPSVEIARHWADTNICPGEIVADNPTLSAMLNDVIALRALCIAAPMLDVTMHPNGLAIVNTESLAPASTERSKEFISALNRHLLGFIDAFIDEITEYDRMPGEPKQYAEIYGKWSESVPAKKIWLATIFQNCSQIVSHTGINETGSDVITSIPIIRLQEVLLAEKWISPELMEVLRKKTYPDEHWNVYAELLSVLRRELGKTLSGTRPFDRFAMRSAVELIRKNPDAFPQWHKSATARLFDPPVFRNKKKSGGYFF